MTITWFSFDGDGSANGPRRPTLDDLGGDQKINKTATPPGVTGPSAEEWNERTRLVQAMAGICPVLSGTVQFVAGAPVWAHFWCINTTVAKEDVTLTDNGTGDTTVTYPAGKLPPARRDPSPDMNEHTAATTISAVLDEVTRTVRVRTWDESSGSGVDTRFSIHLY